MQNEITKLQNEIKYWQNRNRTSQSIGFLFLAVGLVGGSLLEGPASAACWGLFIGVLFQHGLTLSFMH